MGESPRTFCFLALLAAAVALLFVVHSSGTGSGETITVDDDGDADYEKIQDAINASADGDTVMVRAGFYEERLLVHKSISLVGEGSENTTIKKDREVDWYSDDVVIITADRVSFSVKEGEANHQVQATLDSAPDLRRWIT